MYVNGAFFPSISGHNVCCLESPEQMNEKVVIVMDRVCRDKAVVRAIKKMWKKCHVYHLLPSTTNLVMCCFYRFYRYNI